MRVLTDIQMLITILCLAFATILTRALPFFLFPAHKETPPFIKHLQTLLPCAVIGLLVVYCLKDIDLLSGTHGLPEFCAIAFLTLLHIWKRNTLLSISGGTILYMILVQHVFI